MIQPDSAEGSAECASPRGECRCGPVDKWMHIGRDLQGWCGIYSILRIYEFMNMNNPVPDRIGANAVEPAMAQRASLDWPLQNDGHEEKFRRSIVMHLLLGLVMLFAGLGGIPALAADQPELRIGVLAFRGSERALVEWDATLRSLSAQLPEYRVRMIPLDLDGMGQSARAGMLDFVITNPGNYVELETNLGVSRIASLSSSDRPAHSGSIASAVVVLAKRADLTSLAQLRGQRVAAVAPDAFGGFQIAWRELAERGVDPFRDTAKLDFVGFPIDRVIQAVLDGHDDAGIVRACLVEQLQAEGKLAPNALRVLDARPEAGCLASSRAYPEWPFARLATTPDWLAKRVALALLSMPPEDGHSWTVPADYQPVHELFRTLRIGPYAYLRHRSLGEIAQANWLFLTIAGLVALWWLVHVARVETLVRRRTQELRAAHEEARRRREELEHGARLALLGEMAASLAHEINQPLSAIANYASGCERRIAAGTDPEGVANGLRLIAAQAERAGEIVRRMRAFVRKRAPEPQRLDINDAVRSTLTLFQAVAHDQQLNIGSSLAADLPPIVADRVQLEQVMLNLLQNAADAMQGQADRRLTVSTLRAGAGIEVQVADNGRGLSEDVQHHLFEPFFTTRADGLGLGLSLSRSIIEAHGGRLWAEAGRAGGAVFRFTLPAEEMR